MRGINHHEDWFCAAPRFGGGGGGTTSTNTIQNTTPWAGQTPFLTGSAGGPQISPNPDGTFSFGPDMPATPGLFPSAAALYGNQAGWPQYFPSSTYAPLTGNQNSLINLITGFGTSGGTGSLQAADAALQNNVFGPGTGATAPGMNAAQNTLIGQMGLTAPPGTNSNPFTSPGFQNVVNQTLANVIPATSAGFISGGRADSGLAEAAQTAAATNAVGQLGLGQYNTQIQQGLAEQGLQQNAAQLAATNFLNQQRNVLTGAQIAPGIDTTALSGLTAALSASGMSQADQQAMISAAMQRYNYGQTLPWNMLTQYQNAIGGTGFGSGSSGQTTLPFFSNVPAQIGSLASGAGSLALGANALGLFGGGAATAASAIAPATAAAIGGGAGAAMNPALIGLLPLTF